MNGIKRLIITDPHLFFFYRQTAGRQPFVGTGASSLCDVLRIVPTNGQTESEKICCGQLKATQNRRKKRHEIPREALK